MGVFQVIGRRPHLHEWAVSRYLVFETSRSMLIFSRILEQFVGSTDLPASVSRSAFFEGEAV